MTSLDLEKAREWIDFAADHDLVDGEREVGIDDNELDALRRAVDECWARLSLSAQAFGCHKNTIRLRSGKYLDLRDPDPESITLADVGGALSKICRFGGQVDRFYSVAEHSVHCARQALADRESIDIARACLLHDAAEAFLGDVVKPLKILLNEYTELERRMESVICSRFRVNINDPAVREIDKAMLIAERRSLFSADKVEWTGERDVRLLDVVCFGWYPGKAEAQFIETAAALGISA